MAARNTQRRGLSYMEVLIAAGIGLTGILGAVAMFPVAILNMQKGVVVDMMAAAGPSSLDQGKTLRVNDSRNWLMNDAFVGAPTGYWNQTADAYFAIPIAGTPQ